MKNHEFYEKIKKYIDADLEITAELIEIDNLQTAFYHLERNLNSCCRNCQDK